MYEDPYSDSNRWHWVGVTDRATDPQDPQGSGLST